MPAESPAAFTAIRAPIEANIDQHVASVRRHLVLLERLELAATVKNNLRDGYAAQIAENVVASLTPEERAVKQRADLAAGRGGPLPTKLTPTAQPELAQPAPRTTGAGDRDEAER